jgi:TolB protein
MDRTARHSLYRRDFNAADPSAERQARTISSVGPINYAPSPDRQRIAFVTGEDTPSDLYVMNSDGTGLRQLTKDRSTELAVNWLPDGSMISFASERSGNWQQ